MNQSLITYVFKASGPLCDENGVAKQGTAIRVVKYSGTVRAYNTKQAVGFFLNSPQIKAITDYNNIDITTMIDGANEPSMMSLIMLEEGMVASFSLEKAQE